jgi:hypothetical protein
MIEPAQFLITIDNRFVLVDYLANGEAFSFENAGNEIFDYWIGQDPSGVKAALWYNECLKQAKEKPLLDISEIPELQEGDVSLMTHPENFEIPAQWDSTRELILRTENNE